MKTDDLLRMNAAANGRLIVGMLFALNLMGGHKWLACAAVLIVVAAWLSDVLLFGGRELWSASMSLAILIATGALMVATCFAL